MSRGLRVCLPEVLGDPGSPLQPPLLQQMQFLVSDSQDTTLIMGCGPSCHLCPLVRASSPKLGLCSGRLSSPLAFPACRPFSSFPWAAKTCFPQSCTQSQGLEPLAVGSGF